MIARDAASAMSGVILAGGKSSRMGRDKAFLRVDGRTLIERTFAELSTVFHEIIIVSNRPRALAKVGASAVVPDIVKGVGPLGGIHAGLRTMANDYGFFVACDMPFLKADVILDQIAFLKREMCDAVVPRWLRPRAGAAVRHGCRKQGRTSRPGSFGEAGCEAIEPLHAIYSRRCLPAIEACLEAGHRKIIAFYDEVRLCYWDLSPAERWSRYFHNINTKDELLRLMERKEG